MSTKFKLILAVIILILALALGTSVQAAEFESRLFVPSSLNMNDTTQVAYVRGILENLGGDNWQDSWPFKDNPGGTISISAADVVAARNLFCINKPVKLRDSKLEYTGSGVIQDAKNDIEDYVYSEVEGPRASLDDSEIQQAIWYLLGQTSEKPELVYVAEKYAEYRELRKGGYAPSIVETQPITTVENGGFKAGPYKISYQTTNRNSTYFGQILDVVVKDKEGNEVDKSKWSLSFSSNGEFPESNEEFYVVTTTKDLKGPLHVIISFNDLKCKGHYVELTSKKYHYTRAGGTWYCDECKALAAGHSGLTDDGWVYDTVTDTVTCNSTYSDTGPTDAPIEEHTAPRCGNDVTVTYSNEGDTKTVKCGSKYTYYTQNPDGSVTTQDKTASCGGRYSVSVTYKEFVAQIGCGETVHYKGESFDPKLGPIHWEGDRVCPHEITPIDEWVQGQPLRCVWGEREVEDLSLDIEVELTVDIPVEKVWIDEDDKDHTRLKEITVYLLADGTRIKEAKLNAGNEWKYVFLELPRHTDDGAEITYTVEEEELEWYKPTITAAGELLDDGFIITNVELIDIPVEKIWTDNDNPDRPTSIQVSLTADGEKKDTAVLNASNNWKHVFEKLPKYKVDGTKIVYEVHEVDVPFGYEEVVTTSEKIDGGLKVTYTLNNKLLLDLSLRKFISSVNGKDLEVSRTPNVDVTALAAGSSTTAKYNHPKDELTVRVEDLVTYTIRVYNEGGIDAYASEIKDYVIPEQLEYLPNDPTNQKYGWEQSGNTLTTKYLSGTKLSKFDGQSLDYADVQLVLKVKKTGLPRFGDRLVNIAEITKYGADNNGKVVEFKVDRDSKPLNFPDSLKNKEYAGNGSDGSYVKGQEDDDDFDVVMIDAVDFLDLSLRKFITGIDDEDGEKVEMTINEQTAVATSREPVVDVSQLKSLTNPTEVYTADYQHPKDPIDVAPGDFITYTIRVYNEGYELDAYARIIKDQIPDHLEFVPNNSVNQKYEWKLDGSTLSTTYLQNHKLERFDGTKLDYADVQVVLRVKDDAPFNEEFVNVAQISKYAYEFNGINERDEDRDSFADNRTDYTSKTSLEDDDDFEVVKLTVMHIRGIVWLDGVEGKQQERDGVLTDKDERFDGKEHDGKILDNIKVELYKDSALDETTTTDSQGRYVFKRKLIKHNYQVKFEYRGQEYIPVPKYIAVNSEQYGPDKSGACELEADRLALNDKFHEITNGTAKNSNGEATVSLEYDKTSEKHKALINKRAEEFTLKEMIKANTVEFSGKDAYNKGYREYINLGLMERDQINLGVMTDANNVFVTINGKSANYDYSKRDEKAAIELAYKEEDLGRVYNKAILRSDYNFRIKDYNDNNSETLEVTDQSKELEVYVTYKILVQNDSSKPGEVKSLKLYYDPTYKYLNSWYSYKAGENNGIVEWNAKGQTNKFETMTTSSLSNITIDGNVETDTPSKVYVYVKFQVLKDENGFIKTGTKYVVSEIESYTSKEGLIDTTSEPNDISLEKCLDGNWEAYYNTWEDDSDRAPGVNIYVDDTQRTITGYVFEDKATEKDVDNVKVGDGFRQDDEALQNNAIVQLIEKVNVNGTICEYIWQEEITGDSTVQYMDRYGKLNEHGKTVDGISTGLYKFTGYIPGDYIVRFIYGDRVVDHKVVLSGQDYKYTKYTGDTNQNNASYAKDNPSRRIEVMNYSIDMDNAKLNILRNNGEDPDTLRAKTWMYADLVNLYDVQIDTLEPGHNVNFGVVERPKSKLELDVTIAAIKVTNKGIAIVDTENGIGAIKDIHKVYTEIDDELLNGAILEVKYNYTIKNNGDRDTLFNYFEGDPNYGTAEEQHKLIESSARLIYSYAYGIALENGDAQGWTTEGIDLYLLGTDARNSLNGVTGLKIIKPTTERLYQPLLPEGQETATDTVTLSRVLAIAGKDGFIYNNCAEIIVGRNLVGRKDDVNTYGNYQPLNNTPVEDDSASTLVALTEPTGVNPNKPDYMLWISAIGILASGIILIKLTVLRKKD